MSSSTLKVTSFCSYLTSGDVVWADNNYRAMNAVRLVKGEEPTRDLIFNYKGRRAVYNLKNCNTFVDEVVSDVMAQFIKDTFILPVTLVPIPGSKTTSASSENFRTLHLATCIANRVGGGCSVSPSLVFKLEMLSSRKGGPRDPYMLQEALRVLKIPKGRIVLIDDVYTTAAHFKACLWKLEEVGANVAGALAFGQSTKIQNDKVFYVREEEFNCSKVESEDNW